MPKQKAIAVHTLALVVMMGMFLFFTLLLLSDYFPEFKNTITKASCGAKLSSFCSEWWGRCNDFSCKSPEWTSTQDCEQPSPTKCQELIKQK